MTYVLVSVLHFIVKLVLLPVAVLLTIANYMFCFAGGIVCFFMKIIGVLFVLGGILLMVTEPHNYTMGWQAILIGTVFGGVPMFLKDFGSAMLSGVTGALRRI